ncbi:MAG: hypothetical protein R3B90_00850 [Planctomycetaceae bacterium]
MPHLKSLFAHRKLAGCVAGLAFIGHVLAANAEERRWFAPRTTARAASPDADNVGVARLGTPRTAATTGDAASPTIQQAAFHPGYDACPPCQYPADPRVGYGYPCPPTMAPPVIIGGPGVVAFDPTQYPDEYLCDGGDRGHPFHYEGHIVAGLDTEDTVAESVDITGKVHVIPSSKVCIYAPRFGSVRTMSGTLMTQELVKAAGTHEGRGVAGIGTRLRIDEQVQRDRLQAYDVRARASQVDAEARDIAMLGTARAVGHQNLTTLYQHLVFVSDGIFDHREAAILSYGANAASAWTREEYPVMVARDLRGHEVEVEFNAAEYVGVEDKRTNGELRIVKLADKEVARPGDEITFTIRFDNLGQRELRGIRIIDNLTPRLQYVEGSSQSNFTGPPAVTPNGEGSSILAWILDQPLVGESGGTITFRCRVR